MLSTATNRRTSQVCPAALRSKHDPCTSQVAIPQGVIRPRRGRPPGMNSERQRVLAEWALAGMTLGEMAAALGVTPQRIQQQMRKFPDIETARRRVRRERRQREEAERLQMLGFQWIERRKRVGRGLSRFLREAAAHNWDVTVRPRRRVLINGIPLAFHMPRATAAPRPRGCGRDTRYYRFQLTDADRLHVVALPSGRYLFYQPNPKQQTGTRYIPVLEAMAPTNWPVLRPEQGTVELCSSITGISRSAA